MAAKAIQIGFNRCGTRSLTRLFARSGYPAIHWRFRAKGRVVLLAEALAANRAAGRPLLAGLEGCVFFADMEMAERHVRIEAFRWYRQLCAENPDAVFILNLRDRAAWIASREAHEEGDYVARYRDFHGLPDAAACRARWARDWDEHLAAVRAFFADKPGRLVEFRIDRDPVARLIEALPQFDLDARHWGQVGARGAGTGDAKRDQTARDETARDETARHETARHETERAMPAEILAERRERDIQGEPHGHSRR